MGTRSAIIVKVGHRKYAGIYCHWDGYPTHVGKMLFNHYNTLDKAEALIALGDLSSLKENLAPPEGATHTFDNPYVEDKTSNYASSKVTVAYGRDRGETDPDFVHPKAGKTVDEVSDKIDCAYVYVFRNGAWRYREVSSEYFKTLTEKVVNAKD